MEEETIEIVVTFAAYKEVIIKVPKNTDLENLPDKYAEEAFEKVMYSNADWELERCDLKSEVDKLEF